MRLDKLITPSPPFQYNFLVLLPDNIVVDLLLLLLLLVLLLLLKFRELTNRQFNVWLDWIAAHMN